MIIIIIRLSKCECTQCYSDACSHSKTLTYTAAWLP